MPNLLKVYPKLTVKERETILYYIDFDKYLQPYIGGSRKDSLRDMGFLDKDKIIVKLQRIVNDHSGLFGTDKYGWSSFKAIKSLIKKLKED